MKLHQRAVADDTGVKILSTAGSWKRGDLLRMRESNDGKKAVDAVGRHDYVVNGPEWGDSDIGDDSDDMEISQTSKRERDKRGNTFTEGKVKKLRSSGGNGGGREDRAQVLCLTSMMKFFQIKLCLVSPVRMLENTSQNQ